MKNLTDEELVRNLKSESWVAGSNDTDYPYSIHEQLILSRLNRGRKAIEAMEEIRNRHIELAKKANFMDCGCEDCKIIAEGDKV